MKKFTIKNWIGLIFLIIALIGGFSNLRRKNIEKNKEVNKIENLDWYFIFLFNIFVLYLKTMYNVNR